MAPFRGVTPLAGVLFPDFSFLTLNFPACLGFLMWQKASSNRAFRIISVLTDSACKRTIQELHG
jgi:hypothetical protein